MRERIAIEDKEESGGRYFLPPTPLEFFSSGCRLLDCVIGGGWALGRISNIVGDFSTSKTGLAIEASRHFADKFPKGRIRYAESEAAFDQNYAISIGMPLERVEFGEELILTVEDFYNDLKKFVDESPNDPGFYILDSLDALSSEDEQKREFNEGSYDTQKAKKMGKLFRMISQDLKKTKKHLMIISQIRDYIGMSFTKKYVRAGGHSLDFYASQVIWLSHVGIIKKTISKVEKPIGLNIRARCTKNKISIPLQSCDFVVRFGFGVDDLETCMDWLKEIGREDEILKGVKKSSFMNNLNELSNQDYWTTVKEIGDLCEKIWKEIQQNFEPPRRKS
jgi:RecA/RadA recombinase